MKRLRKEETTLTREVLQSIVCDECQKEIERGKKYYEVTTHHDNWGNDSIESYEYLEFCCFKCLERNMKEYYDEPENTSVYEVVATTY